jgi:hypothetical protein
MKDVQNKLQGLFEMKRTSAQHISGRETPKKEAEVCSIFGDKLNRQPRRAKLKRKQAETFTDQVEEAAPNEGFERDPQLDENKQPCKETHETNEITEATAKSNSEGFVMDHERQELFGADEEAMEEHQGAVGVEEPPSDPATAWIPNPRFEELYEDLNDLSSVDGNESPRHKEVKQYARVRRVAKACVALSSAPDNGNEVLLEACAKEEAESAAAIRQQLVKSFGEERAVSLLGPYKNKVMRGSCGKPQRFFVNALGLPLRAVRPKNVTVL